MSIFDGITMQYGNELVVETGKTRQQIDMETLSNRQDVARGFNSNSQEISAWQRFARGIVRTVVNTLTFDKK